MLALLVPAQTYDCDEKRPQDCGLTRRVSYALLSGAALEHYAPLHYSSGLKIHERVYDADFSVDMFSSLTSHLPQIAEPTFRHS